MALRRLPTVQIPRVDDTPQLAGVIESELNDLIIRVNEQVLVGELNASNNRIRHLAPGVEGHDAVNLSQLEQAAEDVIKKFTKLNRPRRPGAVPGAFREFRAEHLQRHPEEICSRAAPFIKVSVKLPVQADKGVGLTDELVLKRNTDYVMLWSDWTTLSANLAADGTAMSVTDPTYIKSNTLYAINNEYIRTGTATGSNPILIDRAQEGSEAAAHVSTDVVKWWAIIPKEGFSADENGILSATAEIDNAERVAARTFEGVSINSDNIPGETSTYSLTLDPGHAISDLVADPRYGEVILSWSEFSGDTYRYKIYKRRNGAVSLTDTYYYDEVPATGTGVYLYTDPLPRPGDASAALGTYGDTFTYGVKAINILCDGSAGDTVGSLSGDATPTNPADDVSDVNASESPVCETDGGQMSEVTVSWTQPSTVDKVRIYMLKDGDTNPALVASFDASPGKFTTPTIGPEYVQDVALYFVSVNAAGEENGVLSSPNTTVTLDGQVSPPTPVSNLRGNAIVGGALLRWNPNAECDLYGYEVADTGDVSPPTQADVLDRHVVGFVAATPETGADILPQFIFEEPIYTGNSDGTTVTIDGEVWPVNAHVVDGTGKNVHFIGAYTIGTSTTIQNNPNISCVSNTADELVFAAGTVPSGIVKFMIRAADGGHKFWVRAVNNSNLKSEWRPEPPTTLPIAALGPDATIDDGVPIVYNVPPASGGSFYFAQNDVLYLTCVARSQDLVTATTKNINSIFQWEAVVVHENTQRTSTSTGTYAFPSDNQPQQHPAWPATPLYLASTSNKIHDLSNRYIYSVDIRARNFYGWSALTNIGDVNSNGNGVETQNRFVRPLAPLLSQTAALSTATNFDLAKSWVYRHSLTADLTVADPVNPTVGQSFAVILTQDGTGGRTATWPSKFKFPNDLWKNPSPAANSRTLFKFYVLDSSNFLLESAPIGGL